MKIKNYLGSASVLLAVMFMTAAAVAQDTKTVEPPAEVQQPGPNQPPDGRANLLRQLGLSQEQIQQIHRIQAERGPMIREAQRRFREANRALDEAIYADEVNDAEVQARLKDVQTAQADVQRQRYMNELAVRRVLTAEQLVRFRELRDRFEQTRRNIEENRPFRNMRQMARPGPANDVKQPPSGPQPSRLVKQEPLKPNQ
jgi:Spy/CpxP family protein refolding chaperone